MSEIAVFGGTFDPPTKAHEAIVQACLDRSDIDKVWVMPSGQRLDKPDMCSNNVRLKMLQVMHAGSFLANPRLTVTDFEMKLPQPTNTAATVKALNAAYPKDNFWFVFGADSYQDMTSWEDGMRLKRTLGMLLVERAGNIVPPEGKNIRHLTVPRAGDTDISSTRARQALMQGEDISRYVSRPIAEFLIRQACHTSV